MAPIFAIILVSFLQPVNGDTVIGTNEIEILQTGIFEQESLWEVTSTTGFSQEVADYTIGMIADEELSFTHARPDNFAEFTSWASSSSTGSNATFGEADSYYTWSRGPDISMGGYDFTGLQGFEIENVSLVLHFSIPDVLNSDEVNILLQNNGADILVSTYARTLSPVNRMTNPLVMNLDAHVEWDWSKLSGTLFTIDYVSDNTGADDSEVRVDAVGLKVKYHQPWYSFENSKAVHTDAITRSPVIDFGPYDGEIVGLVQGTCGLSPSGEEEGSWIFDVEVPPEQELGRMHVFGIGNFTISQKTLGGELFSEIESGELLSSPWESTQIKIEIQDGCIRGARVDINDPEMIVIGRVAGSVSGLSPSASYLRFAIGEELVHSLSLEIGNFAFAVPIGHALPSTGDELEVGVAARFQWASNGTAETTVVHIYSMSISGGFDVEWDFDPICMDLEDLHLEEDEGGQMIPMSSRCDDDLTDNDDLIVEAESSNPSIVEASGEGNFLRIQPVDDAHGSSMIFVSVMDGVGNSWDGVFSVNVQSVSDPPVFNSLPPIVYIELGGTETIEINITDPDSDDLSVTSSKSWAVVNDDGTASLTPVDAGSHNVTITANDGENEVSQSIEVIVTSRPDLVVESMELRIGGVGTESFIRGDVIEIVGFVRNEGREAAQGAQFRCVVNGLLVGSSTIEEIGPGELKMGICDAQLLGYDSQQTIEFLIDATFSIDETDESNNVFERDISVGTQEEPIESGGSSTVVVISALVVISSIAISQLGPRRVKKEFERRK
jgi:hypothetical protein